MEKYKLIAIFGKSGVGKGYFLNELTNQFDINPIIPYTTRPKRENEQDGVDYWFHAEDDFMTKLLRGDMLEVTKFKNWWYGTAKSSLNPHNWNVGIFNPSSIPALMSHDDIKLKFFYLWAPDKIRLMRQLEREEDPDIKEIIRRYGADEHDFKDLEIDLNFYSIDNSNKYSMQDGIEKIAKLCWLNKREVDN